MRAGSLEKDGGHRAKIPRRLRPASVIVRPLAALVAWILLATTLAACDSPPPPDATWVRPAGATVFAVIGDYGIDNWDEASVARLLRSWDPDFVVTTGDNYYLSAGGLGSFRYSRSIGRDYCDFLAGIATAGISCRQPGPAAVNRFFPSLGNHDYTDAGTTNDLPTTYTSYFSLPGEGITSPNPTGNERYYDFVQGPAHFFALNSNDGEGQEPDGTSGTSTQAAWLRSALAASTASWKVVYFHHAPYASGTTHGSSAWMQWPFAQWGADVVFAGHEHNYERVARDGIVYLVNGLGGAARYPCGTPIEGSLFCYSEKHGAQRVTYSETSMTIDFVTVDGAVRDTHTLLREAPVPSPTVAPATG